MATQIIDGKLRDPLEQWIGYRIRRVSAATMSNLAPRLADEAFSATLAAVLLMIEANPGRTQAEIGRVLAIKRANIAPMIGRLETDALVKKQSIDGRSFGLHITRRGQAQSERLASIFTAHDAESFGELTPSERTELKRLLNKTREHARLG